MKHQTANRVRKQALHLPVHAGKCRDELRSMPIHWLPATGSYGRHLPEEDDLRKDSIPTPVNRNNRQNGDERGNYAIHTHYDAQPVPDKDPDKELAFTLNTSSTLL